MKYLETKHEKKAAKVTALVTLILVLLLFFVTSPPYTDPPEEYGVAINFGNPSQVEDNTPEDLPSSPEDSNADDVAENSEPEEVIEEEVVEEEVVEEPEEVVEEIVEEKVDEKVEEDLLKQEAENALKIKDAKEKADKLAKEQKESKEKTEADAIAKVAKAKSDKAAKDKADTLAKAAADRAAKAKAAKAAAAKKAAEGGNSNKIVSFSAVERVPVFPGCTGSNTALKKCMSDKIKAFITKEFDKELPGNVGLSGVQTISIAFKINQQGKVIDINVRANHSKLVTEAKRVASMLPRFKPGMQNGKAVIVPFSQRLKIQTGK